jgi:flagellar biogenesis protein FliO
VSAPIAELEKLLVALVKEHQLLSDAVQLHQDSMRKFKPEELAAAQAAIESSRTRILSHESRRRVVAQQIARLHKLPMNASLEQIAEAAPQYRKNLLRLREELKTLAAQITRKTTVSAKVAGAMLGHLNTVVRVVAGAVQQAAVYTKQGMPTVASRIGVMEAVA